MIFKLTSGLLGFFGVSNPETYAASLEAWMVSVKNFMTANAESATKITAIETAFGTMKGELKTATDTIAAQAAKITDLEAKLGSPATFTEARIKEIAIAAGKEGATTAVAGACAGSPVAAAPTAAPGATSAESLNAAGKFEEAWKADNKLRAEFPTAKSYAAFMKYNRMGAVQLKDDRN